MQISRKNNSKYNGDETKRFLQSPDVLLLKEYMNCLLNKIKELENTNENMNRLLKSLKGSAIERAKTIHTLHNKLDGYAFSNSHKVRAPLARLLGLAKLLHIDAISNDEKDDVNKRILRAAEELENVISDITKLLEKDVSPCQDSIL